MVRKVRKPFWEGVKSSLSIYFKAFFTKEKILKFLEERAIKLALKKLLGTAVMRGIKGWIIRFVVGELMEEIEERIVGPLFRKAGYIKDSINGKEIYRKVENAKDNDDWRDSVRKS